MTLKQYRSKRQFKHTPEPRGKKTKSKNYAFVIQKHAASHLHYDFRLELGGVLLSWAVPKGPCLDPTVKRLAVHVEDHPFEYRKFEGIIPKGQYGGGSVMIWDKGKWTPLDKNPKEAYRRGDLKFELSGEKLQGLWKLIRINKDDKTWLLIKGNDEYAKPLKQYDITQALPNSVVSQRTMDEITDEHPGRNKKIKLHSNAKKSAFPDTIHPELCTPLTEPPAGKEWLHEVKFDGYRLIVFKQKQLVKIITRNNHDWTKKFPTIVREIKKLPVENIILDGEVVVLDEKQHSNFQLLQNAIKEQTGDPFIYYVFDLIYYDHFNLTKQPLLERKKLLKQLIPSSNSVLRYSDHVIGSGNKIWKKSCDMGLEGIVSKKTDSPYVQRRTRDWVKAKCIKLQEFIIGGYTKPRGSRQYFGSLLIGTYDKSGNLIYNGHVGTGFTEKTLKHIYKLLEEHQSTHMPFKHRPPDVKNVTWVKPVLVAEVEFTEMTNDNVLRIPSFKGLTVSSPHPSRRRSAPPQDDRNALTHPNKILYPADKITKQNIADYYEMVQDLILPFIANRPLSLYRCPNGIDKCFFQKHMNEIDVDELHNILVKEKEKEVNMIYLNDRKGLMALVQHGVLEIHPWASQIKKIEYPDRIIFDLDPAPELPWKKVVAAAFEVRKYLLELKLKSFVQSTGGKGLHVVVPIKPEYDWTQIKSFTETFVNVMTAEHPDKYINKMTKSRRTNKIFLDYHRNQRGATAIATYSTRARPHAPVAAPLFWDELSNNYKDTFFTIKTMAERIDLDPWADFFKLKQKLIPK